MMIKAMLRDGLQNGTLSWDALIMKAVSLLLQTISGARADDIRRSYQYEGNERLLWKHIHVCLDTEEVLFHATMDLEYTKGF